MTTETLANLTTEELVVLYVKTSIEQYDAVEAADIRKLNRRIVPLVMAIEEELKSRDGDQRRALIPLYGHRNLRVRINAASATWKLAPDAARRQLEDIRGLNWHPHSMDAGMIIRLKNEGFSIAD